MTTESILWLVAALLWGYLAGRAIAAALDWLQWNTRPVNIPVATGIVEGFERGIRWYVHAVQDIVNGLSAVLGRFLSRVAR